jgi:hypothetical protein
LAKADVKVLEKKAAPPAMKALDLIQLRLLN